MKKKTFDLAKERVMGDASRAIRASQKDVAKEATAASPNDREFNDPPLAFSTILENHLSSQNFRRKWQHRANIALVLLNTEMEK